MKRKAQGEIITTVLIILLVLAAIVIVWQAVRTTTTTAAGRVQTQTTCVGLDLTIEASCVKGSTVAPLVAPEISVRVTRGGDSLGDDAKLKTSVASGGSSGNIETNPFKSIGAASYTETSTWTWTGTAAPATPPATLGDTMTVNTGLVLASGTSCKGSTVTVTCT